MNRLMVNAIEDAIKFIYGQKEKGVINRVITKNDELINNDFEYSIEDWMFEPRIIGERLKTS